MITHILIFRFKKFDSKQKTQKAQRRKTSFPKETVENAHLHKAVLNKTMTTQEKCA